MHILKPTFSPRAHNMRDLLQSFVTKSMMTDYMGDVFQSLVTNSMTYYVGDMFQSPVMTSRMT